MTGEPPVAGTVLRYRYLWRREATAGDRDGHKDRPAAVVLARSRGGETIVVPITHTEPTDAATAVEIPAEERRRIGLSNVSKLVTHKLRDKRCDDSRNLSRLAWCKPA